MFYVFYLFYVCLTVLLRFCPIIRLCPILRCTFCFTFFDQFYAFCHVLRFRSHFTFCGMVYVVVLFYVFVLFFIFLSFFFICRPISRLCCPIVAFLIAHISKALHYLHLPRFIVSHVLIHIQAILLVTFCCIITSEHQKSC